MQGVKIKPLVWEGDGHWHSGDNEGWLEEANTPFGWGYAIEFGNLANGSWVVLSTFGETLTGFDSPEAAKAAAQADYERRILAALEPNPTAQDREALIAATLERAARAMDAWGNDAPQTGEYMASEIRSLITQPQTDALAAVRREARAEGMRIAAGIAFDRRGTQSGDTWDAGWYQACAAARHDILDAAEKEAGHD